MKLDLKGLRIVKCEFRNEMGPNVKLNLQVSVNNQIKLPKELKQDSVGAVITKVMVGSPMTPLYLYLEQVTNFSDSQPIPGEVTDTESMMSLYKTICVPVATEKMEESIKQLCAVYHIPEIQIRKNAEGEKSHSGYLS